MNPLGIVRPDACKRGAGMARAPDGIATHESEILFDRKPESG